MGLHRSERSCLIDVPALPKQLVLVSALLFVLSIPLIVVALAEAYLIARD
jgi:hypothetical protein